MFSIDQCFDYQLVLLMEIELIWNLPNNKEVVYVINNNNKKCYVA